MVFQQGLVRISKPWTSVKLSVSTFYYKVLLLSFTLLVFFSLFADPVCWCCLCGCELVSLQVSLSFIPAQSQCVSLKESVTAGPAGCLCRKFCETSVVSEEGWEGWEVGGAEPALLTHSPLPTPPLLTRHKKINKKIAHRLIFFFMISIWHNLHLSSPLHRSQCTHTFYCIYSTKRTFCSPFLSVGAV